METIQVSHEFNRELRLTVEDAVQFVISEAAKEGELVSGETAWKMLECLAQAKQAEFQGLVA